MASSGWGLVANHGVFELLQGFRFSAVLQLRLQNLVLHFQLSPLGYLHLQWLRYSCGARL